MLRMGCAKVDITPTEPSYLRGYASRNCLHSSIEEPLKAGAMILCQDDVKVLMLTLDNTGMGVKDCEVIYSWLADLGFDASNTYLCCSHTHFAPSISDYYVTYEYEGVLPLGLHKAEESYIELLKDRLRKAVQKAEANLCEVSLEEVDIPVSCVSFNRRTIEKASGKVITNYVYPENPQDFDFQEVDQNLNIWRFRDADGIKAIVGRFSCHPVTGGNDYYAVSADYPGYFQKYVNEFFGCPCMFLQGTAGDVVPMLRNGKSRNDIGMILASSVRLAERRFHRVEDFKLKNAVVGVTLKLVHSFPRDKADELLQASFEKVAAMKNKMEYSEECYVDTARHAFSKVYPTDDATVPIRLMQFGDRILVGLPFEVTTTIAKTVYAAFPEAVITTITGGYEGYILPKYDYQRGGYEVDPGDNFSEDSGDILTEAILDAIRKFRG